jgi:tetratricopeptide (TPR) repeat protein
LEVSDDEVREERYLESLTPAEELAVFLSIRGQCWREIGEYRRAAESFRQAAALSPNVHSYDILATQMDGPNERARTLAGKARTTRDEQ